MNRLLLALTFVVFSCATVAFAQPANDVPTVDVPRSPSDITNPTPDPPATTEDVPPTADDSVADDSIVEAGNDFPEAAIQSEPSAADSHIQPWVQIDAGCPQPVCTSPCEPICHAWQPACQPHCQPVCKRRRFGCWRRR